jgi:HEAT repeat protein
MVFIFSFLVLNAAIFDASMLGAATPDESDINVDLDKQRETLRYGTDNEIKSLIQTLKKGNDGAGSDKLDDELAEIVTSTKNAEIKSAVIAFFSERKKTGLEEEARYLIENRDEVESVNVSAAIDYLGKIKDTASQKTLRGALEADEDAYRLPAIRAIGLATDESNNDETSEYLIEYYNSKNLNDDCQSELLRALGSSASKKAVPFLNGIIADDIRPGLTMAALSALAMIKDDDALATISGAAASRDPNIRATAIEAMGSFSGAEAQKAIIDAFRDSYYKTRIAACKASAKNKMTEAIPYLKYRAENDEQQSVKDEAIRALGSIGTDESAKVLFSIFENKKAGDHSRVLVAGELLKIDADGYAEAVIAAIDEAKRTNQKNIAQSLSTAISKAKTGKLKPFAARLFAGKDAADKAFALAITENNGFSEFKGEVQILADDKNSALARRAREILEKL